MIKTQKKRQIRNATKKYDYKCKLIAKKKTQTDELKNAKETQILQNNKCIRKICLKM